MAEGVGLDVGVVLGVGVGVAVAVGVIVGVGETVGVTDALGVAVGVTEAVAVAVAVGVTVGVGVGDDSTHPIRFASTLDNEPTPVVYPPTIIGICPPTTLRVTASANVRDVLSKGP